MMIRKILNRTVEGLNDGSSGWGIVSFVVSHIHALLAEYALAKVISPGRLCAASGTHSPGTDTSGLLAGGDRGSEERASPIHTLGLTCHRVKLICARPNWELIEGISKL